MLDVRARVVAVASPERHGDPSEVLGCDAARFRPDHDDRRHSPAPIGEDARLPGDLGLPDHVELERPGHPLEVCDALGFDLGGIQRFLEGHDGRVLEPVHGTRNDPDARQSEDQAHARGHERAPSVTSTSCREAAITDDPPDDHGQRDAHRDADHDDRVREVRRGIHAAECEFGFAAHREHEAHEQCEHGSERDPHAAGCAGSSRGDGAIAPAGGSCGADAACSCPADASCSTCGSSTAIPLDGEPGTCTVDRT